MKRMKKTVLITLMCVCIISGLVFGLLFATRSDAAKKPVTESSMKTSLSKEEIVDLNKQYQKKRLDDVDLNADIAVVTFLRFISEMSVLNSTKMNKYLTVELGLNNASDRTVLINQAKLLTSQGNEFQKKAKGLDKDLRKSIAVEKGKAIKSVEKSLKKSLTKEGWQTFNNVIKTRVMPNTTLIRK